MKGQCSISKKWTLPRDACILLSEYKAMVFKYWESDLMPAQENGKGYFRNAVRNLILPCQNDQNTTEKNCG